MSAGSREARAFAVYLELGVDRSLVQLADMLRADPRRAGLRRSPSLRTLEDWSSRYKWRDRVADIERQAREEAEKEHLESVKRHRERLRQEGRLLQERGIEWLKRKGADDVSANEGLRAVDLGFRLEGLALGEATERVVVEEGDERVERLSDEEIDLIIRLAREAERRGTQDED